MLLSIKTCSFFYRKYLHQNCRQKNLNPEISIDYLFIFSDAPYCKPGQVQVFGVARDETARIGCEVIANPQSSVFFEWRFNTSGETVDMPHDRFRSTNSRSVVEYVPRTELDYGSLLCWASNSIGRQREPCIFHLVPAGVPDNLTNCSIGNQTTSSLQVVYNIQNRKLLRTKKIRLEANHS